MTNLGVTFRPQRAPEELRAVAEAADASGVDELWLWEDCFEEGGIASAAAALAWTERLHVGIGILPVPLRNPAVAAMEIASLVRMFGERIHVGVGHGVLEWMAQVGARAASPMTLLREYVMAVQALLAGDTVTTEGEYARLREVKLGWPPAAKPALHVGGVGPRTVALAGELGDGLIMTGGNSIDDLVAARQVVDSSRGDRPGRCRITAPVVTTPGADGEQRFRTEMQHWGHDPDLDAGAYGDAEAIAATVRRWAAAGADTVVLQPTAEEEPVAFARFAGTEVRPLI
jgi:alkanesulfonate monooxygenase SsuD/methylene tetrahydromethanopterin reductase-like flavin-dependent oxidoreductase (luciferase family)